MSTLVYTIYAKTLFLWSYFVLLFQSTCHWSRNSNKIMAENSRETSQASKNTTVVCCEGFDRAWGRDENHAEGELSNRDAKQGGFRLPHFMVGSRKGPRCKFPVKWKEELFDFSEDPGMDTGLVHLWKHVWQVSIYWCRILFRQLVVLLYLRDPI